MRVGQIGIRRATIKDASAIATIHDEAWRLAYRGIIPGPNLERMVERRGAAWWAKAVERRTAVLVLEVSSQVCGYATIGPSRMRMLPFGGEIYEIYLKPEYQGLGFGKHLFKAVREEMRRYGFERFLVRALADNDQARGFYEHVGGVSVSESTERIGDKELPIVVYGWNAA